MHTEEEDDTSAESEEDEDSEDESEEASESSDDSEGSEDSEDSEEDSETEVEQAEHVSAIQAAELSPDGTCILASEYSKKFSIYVIDQNILQADNPLKMTPYSQYQFTDPIWAMATNPLFDLSDLSTTTVLLSQRDSYVKLYNPFWTAAQSPVSPSTNTAQIGPPLASYKNTHSLREHIIVPTSLTYTRSGSYFIAGCQSELAIFNLEYPSAPIQKLLTYPKNEIYNTTKFKGTISALAVSSTRYGGVLAAGTRERHVALYEREGIDQTQAYTTIVLEKELKAGGDGNEMRYVAGNGVSSIKWSPCATYLYVAERNSDIIYVYDIRNFQSAVSYCTGRNAFGYNRLGFDVWAPFQVQSAGHGELESSHHEIWAGGVDGKVRIWRDPHLKEGAVHAEDEIFVGEDPVTNTLVHSSGSLAVMTSGSRELARKEGGMNKRFYGGMEGLRKMKSRGRIDILGLGLETRVDQAWEGEMVERLRGEGH